MRPIKLKLHTFAWLGPVNVLSLSLILKPIPQLQDRGTFSLLPLVPYLLWWRYKNCPRILKNITIDLLLGDLHLRKDTVTRNQGIYVPFSIVAINFPLRPVPIFIKRTIVYLAHDGYGNWFWVRTWRDLKPSSKPISGSVHEWVLSEV